MRPSPALGVGRYEPEASDVRSPRGVGPLDIQSERLVQGADRPREAAAGKPDDLIHPVKQSL